ncbi:hypothetical protein L1887_13111 [Cichorium endivia]|nr:hypothetical protein L1887_13111 [Cichorium endivia]
MLGSRLIYEGKYLDQRWITVGFSFLGAHQVLVKMPTRAIFVILAYDLFTLENLSLLNHISSRRAYHTPPPSQWDRFIPPSPPLSTSLYLALLNSSTPSSTLLIASPGQGLGSSRISQFDFADLATWQQLNLALSLSLSTSLSLSRTPNLATLLIAAPGQEPNSKALVVYENQSYEFTSSVDNHQTNMDENIHGSLGFQADAFIANPVEQEDGSYNTDQNMVNPVLENNACTLSQEEVDLFDLLLNVEEDEILYDGNIDEDYHLNL